MMHQKDAAKKSDTALSLTYPSGYASSISAKCGCVRTWRVRLLAYAIAHIADMAVLSNLIDTTATASIFHVCVVA